MTTRGAEILHQRQTTHRRSSIRQALAVIPNTTGLSVSIGSPLVGANNSNNDIRDRISPWHPSAGATSSPDEMVIQKRGRRSRTIIWSPEADSKRTSLLNYSFGDRTPDKISNDLQSPIGVRENISIRKRLELSCDFDESQLATPEKKKKSLCIQNQYTGKSMADGLRGLSNDQLVNMIMNLVTMQEEGTIKADSKLRDVIMNIMPIADIKPLQDKLHALQRNIYGSLVTSNEFAYIRAYMHLDAFQKSLDEQGNMLVQSQHWTSLMQYSIAAWTITKELPDFENEDNTAQKCFAKLVNFCKQALLNGNFTNPALELYINKMEIMAEDCCDIKICLQMAREILQ
ncbi:hypothetical protein PV328_009260 [Microctonus aethiopoides]|uniref:Uncharacterized protein n=1 Tax=Microctonus aethiopoides TaxID=144406 RepID=A0AA39C5H1_9HYME|nr:hypothetical protein PV328_009260 [Microctonus aethiopoides]